MSRDLCKLAKGALVPLKVKPVKDGEDDPLHALHVHKSHHRARASPHFHEAGSITLVVRSFRQRARGQWTNASNSGKPSFSGEWVRLVSAQLTPFVCYTKKVTSPLHVVAATREVPSLDRVSCAFLYCPDADDLYTDPVRGVVSDHSGCRVRRGVGSMLV